MYHIRKTKTGSKATAIQVVQYIDRKLKVAAHIGSARNNKEVRQLKEVAASWIQEHESQPSLFESQQSNNRQPLA